MQSALLASLEAGARGLEFPASKEEVLAHLAAAGAGEAVHALVQAMPGTVFHYPSDLLSIARLAVEMAVQQPWPGAPTPTDDTERALVAAVREGLARCPQTNARLVRVSAGDGTLCLDGRATDVSQGVAASRVALGVAPDRQVINRLEISS